MYFGIFRRIFSSVAPHRGQLAAKFNPRWQPTRRLAVSSELGRCRIQTRDCRTTVWCATIEPPHLPEGVVVGKVRWVGKVWWLGRCGGWEGVVAWEGLVAGKVWWLGRCGGWEGVVAWEGVAHSEYVQYVLTYLPSVTVQSADVFTQKQMLS